MEPEESGLPLTRGVGDQRYNQIRTILSHKKGRISGIDETFESLLLYAANRGNSKAIRMLLKIEDIVLNVCDEDGRSPLSFAAEGGFSQIMSRLLEGTGIDPNLSDKKGRSPLMYACMKGRYDAVELLLNEDGIDPNFRDEDGRTALSYAIEWGHFPVVSLLLSKSKMMGDDLRSTLMDASRLGHESVVRLLLEDFDVDFNICDGNSRSALSIAAEMGHKRVVELLLEQHGINVNSCDENNRTPLSYAAENANGSVVDLLCQQPNIRLNLTDKSGQNALLRATQNKKYKVIAQLVKTKGIDVNIMDNDGFTPTVWAAVLNDSRLMELFRTKDSTALHLLVQNGGKRDWLKSLLDAGYDANACDSDGKSLLRLAIRSRRLDLVQELLEQGASTKDVMAFEWHALASKSAMTNSMHVQLSEGSDKKKHVEFPATLNILQPYHGSSLHLFLSTDESIWPNVPKRGSTKWIDIDEAFYAQHDIDDDVVFTLYLTVPREKLLPQVFNRHSSTTIRIAWKMARLDDSDDDTLQTTTYYSNLPYGTIPSDILEFFGQFLTHTETLWTHLCAETEEYLSEIREEQLVSEGKHHEFMHQLAQDARQWTNYRKTLRIQTSKIRQCFRIQRRYHEITALQKVMSMVDMFETRVNGLIEALEQTQRELLQIEFMWSSVIETRVSTRLSQNVMLLTYVSIFYLPLGFCAALWAIPNIESNATRIAFLVTSILVGSLTLLVSLNLEHIGRGYSLLRRAIVDKMREDDKWKATGEKLEDLVPRKKTTEWVLLAFVIEKLVKKFTKQE